MLFVDWRIRSQDRCHYYYYSTIRALLPDDFELVGFGNYRQPAPSAMELTDGIYILNHALLAIVAVVLVFEVDDS